MSNNNVLDSKIKRLIIELPHYSFSHSSSGDSSHTFVSRERSQEKLKGMIEDSTEEPGVYMITGNRGVGKTNLVSQVIKDTSLLTNDRFFKNLGYLFLILLAVVAVQFCSEIIFKIWPEICLKKVNIWGMSSIIIWWMAFGLLSFGMLCRSSGCRRKFYKRGIFRWKKTKDFVISGLREMSGLINPYNPHGKAQYLLKAALVVSYTQICLFYLEIAPVKAFIIYIGVVFLFMYIRFIRGKLRWDSKTSKKGAYRVFFESILNPVSNYIKNHNRFYLRINFGHKLRDEKDILRLIARTLATEYYKYSHSFWRLLPWRALAFGGLFLFAYLFSGIVEPLGSYKSIKNIVKEQLLDTPIKVNSGMMKTMVTTNVDSTDKVLRELTTVEANVETKISAKIGIFLFAIKGLVFDISDNIVRDVLASLNIKIPFVKKMIKKFIFPINYLFWLSFFLMYLFYRLLFRCNWITHFFVTHRIINRRLKKLNRDITYSTERENSIGITSEKTGPAIGTRARKSRNIADAREIEKELHDILEDTRRIPGIMCRPNVVIVFDELDKVEPGDTGSDKDGLQTKASLFSIGATRDRQTEILRILSNLKYFLSTAYAKFIFIAGREVYDVYLADVSERNNYIGSIFNLVIHVPSFLTDHPTGKRTTREESSIASLPEEFVCRRLFPRDSSYPVDSYDLKNYREYLEKEIYKYKSVTDDGRKKEIEQQIQKIIAVLQQFIIYLAHISKGAPKKMIQLFETFVAVREIGGYEKKKSLVVHRYHSSRHFLSFGYYKQYTLGIVAYLMTPIFYRLSESNIKEHSDKLLVSTLRFVDFLFKFHKYSFSWKQLEISPELMEVNRAPELKSVAVELINYLAQVHINRSNFSLYDYKFDSWIANEIFTMTKTDDVFSALFSFSLDEMLPMKKQYQEQLEKAEREYMYVEDKTSVKYTDAISSLQIVLGDLCYFDDEVEEAGIYYKKAIQLLRPKEGSEIKTPERLYLYIRNKLKLGVIHERRRQYDFAYQTYWEICKQIVHGRDNVEFALRLPKVKKISSYSYDIDFDKMSYEGLKMLYLPFIAKFQILEKSHVGGITGDHLTQLYEEFKSITFRINHNEARLLEAEFFSRVADILYYKNSDLIGQNKKNMPDGCSCTACDYYRKALYTLLGMKPTTTVQKLLRECVVRINDNYNVEYCTILARILSDWGNVFFSCNTKSKIGECCIGDATYCYTLQKCCCCSYYICDVDDCETNSLGTIAARYINYVNSESKREYRDALLKRFETRNHFSKMEIAFAMYAISSVTYRNANLYKRSAYQLYKMLCLFKHYGIYKIETSKEYIETLSRKAIHYLWHANDDLTVFELNKRKKDFDIFNMFGETDKTEKNGATIETDKAEEASIKLLPNLLVDSDITKIRILVKEMELEKLEVKLDSETSQKLQGFYDIYITSPYKINYSVGGRIYRLYLKSILNGKTYEQLTGASVDIRVAFDETTIIREIKSFLDGKDHNDISKKIFDNYFNFENDITRVLIDILDNLIAETIYSLVDIGQLTETMGETYVFTHSFLGLIHERLSLWIMRYKGYKKYLGKRYKSRIDEYLERYLDHEWRELLFAYRENQQALSHYQKSLELHSGGKAYHDMIDTMYYVKDDYNDRLDHFNIAEERHLIVSGKIQENIDKLKGIYRIGNSKGGKDDGFYIYKPENYFEKDPDKKPENQL